MNRGGSWNNSAGNCRAANRNNNSPGNRNNNLGFRVLAARWEMTWQIPSIGQEKVLIPTFLSWDKICRMLAGLVVMLESKLTKTLPGIFNHTRY